MLCGALAGMIGPGARFGEASEVLIGRHKPSDLDSRFGRNPSHRDLADDLMSIVTPGHGIICEGKQRQQRCR